MTNDFERLKESLRQGAFLETVFSSYLIKSTTRWKENEEMKVLCFNFEGADHADLAEFGFSVIGQKWSISLSIGNMVLIEKPTGVIRQILPEHLNKPVR